MNAQRNRDTPAYMSRKFTHGERERRRLVERKCAVCEWQAEVAEVAGDAGECPWCHAPTELVRVIGELEPAVATANEKNPHAAALGRLGGLKGGRARADALSATRRRELARKAARARWRKHKRAQ